MDDRGASQCNLVRLFSDVRPCTGVKPIRLMAEAIGCPVVVAFDGKGAFPEEHPQFMGVLWGDISSPGVSDYVRSADVILSAGSGYYSPPWLPLCGRLHCGDVVLTNCNHLR